MFETQKSGNKISSGEFGLNIRTFASPKVGQDKVSGGVSVLCWHAAPLQMFYGNLAKSGKKLNSVIRSRSVNRVKNCCNVWSKEGVTVYGHHPVCRVTFGRRDLIFLLSSPYRPWNFLRDDLKRSLTYPCPRSLLESRIALRIKLS